MNTSGHAIKTVQKFDKFILAQILAKKGLDHQRKNKQCFSLRLRRGNPQKGFPALSGASS
jgi:hypothetical protein